MSRLERWSRIKRGLEPDEQPSVADPETKERSEPPLPPDEADPANGDGAADNHEAGATEASEPVRPAPPPPGSLDETLPDPETLEAGSDFSGYMVPGVSSALRRRALKRLWATGNYNVRDGLDDYDLDYRQQLKPMASELAGKLRRWAKKADESLADNANDTQSEQASTDGDSEQVSSADSDAPNPPGSEKEVAQDDQSDNSHTKA